MISLGSNVDPDGIGQFIDVHLSCILQTRSHNSWSVILAQRGLINKQIGLCRRRYRLHAAVLPVVTGCVTLGNFRPRPPCSRAVSKHDDRLLWRFLTSCDLDHWPFHLKIAVHLLVPWGTSMCQFRFLYFYTFLPARRYASAGLCDSDVSVCLSVRPSVCPSHAGIVHSIAKAGSWNVHHLIAPWL